MKMAKKLDWIFSISFAPGCVSLFGKEEKYEIKSSPFEAAPRFAGCCGWAGSVGVGYLGAWNLSWSGM